MSDDEWRAWYRHCSKNPERAWSALGAYDNWSIWWPATTWGAGFLAGMRYALLVAEDHGYHSHGVVR